MRKTRKMARQLIEELETMQRDLEKTLRGNATACQRFRTASIQIAKKFLEFRKISIKEFSK